MKLKILACIPFFLILIAPAIHEASHLLSLELLGKAYKPSFKFSLTGLYGEIKVFSGINLEESLFVLSAGFLMNFLIGLFFLFFAWKKSESSFAFLSLVGSMCLLFHSLMHFFLKGDLATILQLTDLEFLIPYLPMLGIASFSILSLIFFKCGERISLNYLRNIAEVPEEDVGHQSQDYEEY